MSLNRYAKKKDANHRAIIDSLRKLGATVIELDEIDSLVGWQGKNYLFEIKSPEAMSKKMPGTVRESELTPYQKNLIDNWKGQYNVIFSIDDALKILLNK